MLQSTGLIADQQSLRCEVALPLQLLALVVILTSKLSYLVATLADPRITRKIVLFPELFNAEPPHHSKCVTRMCEVSFSTGS